MKTNRLYLAPLFALVGYACSPGSEPIGYSQFDSNGDTIADDLGTPLDNNNDGVIDQIDINIDGVMDGMGVDRNGDGVLDALLIDLNCDGYFEAIDTDGDLMADLQSALDAPTTGISCPTDKPADGTGGAPPIVSNTGGNMPAGNGGSTPVATGGMMATGGAGFVPSTGGMPAVSMLGGGQYQGAGRTQAQYHEDRVFRDGVGYMFIANGWGTRWQSHDISYNGTSFTVHSLAGSQGDDYSPAGYPTVFCGNYSMKDSPGDCGLPAAISSLNSVKTGWRWKANGNGQYNAAWDIWLSNDGSSLSAYLMVWLRDPPGQQPAGAVQLGNTSVQGLPGTWQIWTGQVNGRPIVNYVQPEGQDMGELEFDVLDVYNDAISRGYNLPGSHILSVAIGFEVWNGPVSEIATEDFYVAVD